ncbi:Nucleoside H+ symporter [Prosthecobacter debontii]|uniref:Nucleoside H+ symporter n=2 Tax=Prosthecobacter debontii TaxID=48467 RepID=A0A1T4YG64_9BACT|nr:Nucleoside H+ symporter [Prosthecobacter debontii]
MGMWNVPLANIYTAYGKGHLVPWVLATTAIAAFIAPLFVGALADQKTSPTLLLRWLALATSATLGLTCLSLAKGWSDGMVLLCAQIQALVATPVWSIANSIIFSQLHTPTKQFGPLRACATLGWMAGCWIVSLVLHADASLTAGYAASMFWLLVMGLSWMLPVIQPGDVQEKRSFKQILGLDALDILKHRDHRVVFITAALYSIPLAAFYPYTAKHLRDLGVENISAAISLAQVSEILTMLLLAGVLARFRLKWVFLAGIAICTFRYGLNALNTQSWVLLGTSLHGFAYTLYFITTQIYLEDRIEHRLRARSQALLYLLMSGVGNLIGYLGGGWWHSFCTVSGQTNWNQFWLGETILTAAVCLSFAVTYRGARGCK